MATSHIVSVDELHALRKTLSSPEMDQGHLFAGWPSDPGNYTTKQLDVLQQLHRFSFQYKGGVASLIQNGRRLLSASQCCPYINVESPAYVFHAPSLEDRSAELDKLEETSSSLLKKTVFALVAGGLGERLGFPGIKVGLPLNTATGITYLEHYCSWAKAVGGEQVPFVIMTSDDTHTATLELIEELQLKMPNLRVVKQDTVFCFSDREAHLAIDDKGMLIRKPHGHGDIHTLLHASVSVGTDGKEKLLVDQWVDEGYSYIAFFQDTNGASTTTIPISLAISNRERLDMNMTCVQRRPKEALGLLCRVQLEPSKEWKTINVEYNDFEEVAKTLTKEGGDVAVAGTQYSAYPGNTNTIIYNLVSYASVLKASGGAVPEFINPKYTDATKTTFKKPARIESLMQDFARLFKDGEHRVGGCVFDRFCYQPVKNSMEASLALHEKEASLFSALSGEADGYELTRRRLMAVGVPLQYHPQAVEVIVADRIPAHLFPIITADAVCLRGGFLREWSRVFPSPTKVRISPSSVLCLEGNVVIESLSLDGVLRISGPTSPCAPPLVVTGVNVANAHWQVRPTSSNDSNPVDLIRGFVLEKSEAQHLRVDSAATNQQSRQHKSSL